MRIFYITLLLLLASMLSSTSTSAQAGFTWESIGGPQGYVPIKLLSLDSAGGAWAASERILYRSRDEGRSWERIFEHFNAVSMSVSPDGRIVAMDRYGNLQLSADNGDTWSTDELDIVNPRNYHRIFLVDDSTQIVSVGRIHPYQLFRTRDTGRTWTLLTDCGSSIDTAHVDRIGDRVFITRCEGLAYFDLNDPNDSLYRIDSFWPVTNVVGTERGPLYTAVYSGVWKSTNNGRNWSPVLDIRYLEHLLQVDSATILAIDRDSILSSRDEGETWEHHAATDHYSDVEVLRTGGGRLLASTANHLYASDDTGQTWSTSWQGIEGMTIGDMVVAADGTIILGAWNSAFHIRDAITGAWTYVTDDQHPADWPLDLRTNVVVDLDFADSATLFAGTSGGVARSTDVGRTWQRMIASNRPIQDIAVSRDGVILARYNVFSGSTSPSFLRSTDFGETWESFDSRRKFGGLYHNDRYNAFLATGLDRLNVKDTVLWRSTDAGVSWEEVQVGKPGGNYYIDHRTGDIYMIEEAFINDPMKLWRSVDGGETWSATPMLYGLRSKRPVDLAVTQQGDVYFIADTSLYVHYLGDSVLRRIAVDGPGPRLRGIEVMPDGRLLVDAGRTGLYLSSRSVLHVPDRQRSSRRSILHHLGNGHYRLEVPTDLRNFCVVLYNLEGRQILKEEALGEPTTGGLSIDLGRIPRGIYLLSVEAEDSGGTVEHHVVVRM